ncbi:MAG TPA: hypothetical protein VL068_09570 [Microthrixaceae bacterium]|nr:hypothetical protein [Microthrixaceae bacterium]
MARTVPKRTTALLVFGVMAGLLAGACTPAGPPARDWKVSPSSITVNNKEDQDKGDEPYVMQLGFRAKLGVKGSASTTFSSQCYNKKLPAQDAAPSGTTIVVPAGAADITFNNVQRLDLGDLAIGTAPFEIMGTLTFVAERDGIFASCAVSDVLRSALAKTVKDAMELLIARSPVPPTSDALINLVVDNIGNFLQAAASLVGAVVEGLGDPDDIIGVAAQIHLPTNGALTDLIKTGLSIGGLFAPGLDQGFIPVDGLPSSLQIKVGTLNPSKAKFHFTGPGYDYNYVSVITR